MRIKTGLDNCKKIIALGLLLCLAGCGSGENVTVYEQRQEADSGSEWQGTGREVSQATDQENTGEETAGGESVETEEVNKGSNKMEVVTQGADEATVYVQINGAVCAPGVYRVPKTARVFEAVEAAGGFTETACMEAVNLARTVTDEMMIYIPTREEMEKAEKSDEIPRDAQATDKENRDKASLDNENKEKHININTASKEELMTLPGVGEARAEAILLYRKEHGFFQDITEIMNVSGIKQAAFEKIRDRITT